MSEILKKPYEISIWEDYLETFNGINYYKENRIAVIGSNTMTTQNRVYSPVLQESVNGEVTLTFSLRYKYFDENVGDFVVNPFASFLVNERKVKLHYNNKWYEFLIKEREEASEDYTFTYTATDAFINELSKTGYNIEFDIDLNNNQGTIIELATKALENTDWIVDETNSDTLRQLISEPIYLCEVSSGSFEAKNLDTNDNVTINTDEKIYVFYSYIANQETEYVQFLRLADKDSWRENNNHSYIGTNYRFLQSIEYIEENSQKYIKLNDNIIISIKEINTLNQGHRLVYNQKTTYDPIMQKTVDIYQLQYENDIQDIYHYDDSIYSTSAIITPIITGGNNFATFSSEGISKGWDNATTSTSSKLQNYSLVTFPKINANSSLVALDDLHKVTSYLEFEYPEGAGTWSNNFINSFFNSGFTDNASTIGSIARGEKYVFRVRYKIASEQINDISEATNATIDNASIRAVVAGYRKVKRTLEDNSTIFVKEVVPSQIYFNFENSFAVGNNYIRGGIIENNKYYIDGIAQVPSMQYIYITEDAQGEYEWIWDIEGAEFIPYDNSFNDYLYVIAEAQKGLTQAEIQDVNNRIGIFIYDSDITAKYVYIEDIQIFPFVADGNEGKPVLPGNAPKTESHIIPYYYLKPNINATINQITTYTSLKSLADGLGVSVDDIKPLRNEKCEKVLSINVNKSNYFNILQTLCETFECWLDINVEHDLIGRIKLDQNFKPIKKIAFKEYIGKDNFAGFKYGINLKTITRRVDSNEIVSKLIVGQPASEYTNNGILSITDSSLNTSRESYILNLNYYINQNLISNKEALFNDIYQYNEKIADINKTLQQLENEKTLGLLNLNKLAAQRNVFVELIEKAQDARTKALDKFETVTTVSYEQYRKNNPDNAEIFNQPSVQNIIGEIYSNAAIDNSYNGLITSTNEEYKKLELDVKGAQTYSVIVSTTKGENEQEDSTKITVSHYVEGLVCKFLSDDIPPEIFTPSINKQEYSLPHIYNKLVITSVPANYQISYNYNEQIITIPEHTQTSFDIYDIENDCGLIKRFTLVPTEEYQQKYPGYDKQIEDLLLQKQEEENKFNSKYGRFIKEGTWESTDYINPDLYYLDALQVSNTSAEPQVTYEINVVDISQIKGYENYNFALGDKTYIEDTEFFGYKTIQIGYDNDVSFIKTPIQEEVIVSQIEWHLDEPDQNIITVQNYKTQFEDLFQRISAAVQSVQYNTPIYQRAANILDDNGQIKASILANSLNQLGSLGGLSYNLAADGLIRVTDDGLLIQNLTQPKNLLIIRSRGIDISTDGGVKWTTILSPDGINADQINAGTIDTNKILIMDGENPSFCWDKVGLNAYGYGDNGYDLKTFVRFDKHGLYGVKNSDAYEYNSLAEIKDNAQFGLTWDGFFIKNNYTNGYVSISSDNDFQVIRNIDEQEIEKIKIGALEFDSSHMPTRYGINIRNDNGDIVFTTGDNGDLTITGIINAKGGNIGGMSVTQDKLQMDTICLEPGVGIYSTVQTQVGTHPIYEQVWHEPEQGEDGYYEYIDTGEVEEIYEPVFMISDTNGAATFNNANVRGTITALQGDFLGEVRVGPTGQGQDHIIIDGTNALIRSSNYQDGAGYGWMINKDGDAVFNNITARGAIRTAVFEYAEIQAVGGIFIFRPSSTIREAVIAPNETDLIITVEKPYLFEVGAWCKISNYIDNGADPDVRVNNILLTNGLTHVYRVSAANGKVVTLAGAAAMVEGAEAVVDIDSLVGGALIDMGNKANGNGKVGTHNYGIGVNSSDNTVNLPARAITLFETIIDETRSPKVSYKYRGILGTLPELPTTQVEDSIYNRYMVGTQGIYTDNMYLGDNEQFLTFYTDTSDPQNPKKKLRIRANQVVFEVYDKETGEPTGEYQDMNDFDPEGTPGPAGQDAISVVIESNVGNEFIMTNETATLTCTVYQGIEDITSTVTNFLWTKNQANGIPDVTWNTAHENYNLPYVEVTPSEINKKAIFGCRVTLPE